MDQLKQDPSSWTPCLRNFYCYLSFCHAIKNSFICNFLNFFSCLCVRIHVCVCACAEIYEGVICISGMCVEVILRNATRLLWGGVRCPGDHQLGKTGCLSPLPQHWDFKYTPLCLCLVFLCRLWGLNSGPNTYTTNTLMTELSLQPLSIVLMFSLPICLWSPCS